MDLLDERFSEWGLTKAEADVALFAIKGLSTAEIAGLRQTSEGTVKAQTNAIYRKAGVSGRSQLLSLFIEDLMRDDVGRCGSSCLSRRRNAPAPSGTICRVLAVAFRRTCGRHLRHALAESGWRTGTIDRPASARQTVLGARCAEVITAKVFRQGKEFGRHQGADRMQPCGPSGRCCSSHRGKTRWWGWPSRAATRRHEH